MIIGLSKKVLGKNRLELLELHQRVCKAYLVQKGLTYKTRNQFFKLYGLYISDKNIEAYFFIPINLFAQALVKNELTNFFKYIKTTQHVHGNSKKSIHRKV